MERLKLPVGIENFEEIRREGFYYIDKTGMIRDLLNNWGKVNLFTRPRRFGKTLNMSMLKSFFEIGTDKTLFDRLAISQETALCEAYMGKHLSLIHISTAEIVNSFITGKNKYTMIRQENAGISAARNTAINHASGEYICFVDGDDLIADNSIQSLVSAAKENDADIVKGKYGLKRGSKITEKGYASGYIWGGYSVLHFLNMYVFPLASGMKI